LCNLLYTHFNAYIICVTDGEFHQQTEVSNLLSSHKSHSTFFEFIGIGKYGFSYLNTLSNTLENCNYFNLVNLSNESLQNKLNKRIIGDYQKWFKQAKEKGIAKY